MSKKNYNKEKYYHEYNNDNIEDTKNNENIKPDYWYHMYDENGDFRLRCCF